MRSNRASRIFPGGAFLLAEGLGMAAAFATLPHDIARDAVWPSYLLECFSWYVSASDRWPIWHGVGYFLSAQLLPASCLVLVLFGIPMATRNNSKALDPTQRLQDRALGRSVFLAAVFFVGACIYFRHTWHFTQYTWTLILAGALGFSLPASTVSSRLNCGVAAGNRGERADTFSLTCRAGHRVFPIRTR